MALATRCPACSTVFRISTAQAAAKGGMVRCGQCRNVFNSLDALVRVEDLEVIDESVVEAAAVPPGAAEQAEDTPSLRPVTDPGDVPAAVDGSDLTEESLPVVSGERAVIHEWWLPEPRLAVEKPVEKPEAAPEVGLRDDAGQLLSGRRTDLQWTGADLESTNPSFMRPEEPRPPAQRAARWALTLLALVALVGLLGQAAYLWRDELAARWSPARNWLVASCRVLQCKVDYPTHLDAITIESAAIKTNGPNLNVYELTALLRNHDSIDVRYPHLELVLTDLQDRPILRRALRPEDYLPRGREAGRALPPGFAAESELPIRIMFELTDVRFAGFRVERFYP